MKRLAGLAQAAAKASQIREAVVCALCERPIGRSVERHHVIPKSEGGTDTVPVHPICHRTIHAFVANRDLATSFTTMDQLRERDDVRRFLRWIAGKPADFRAPTRRSLAP